MNNCFTRWNIKVRPRELIRCFNKAKENKKEMNKMQVLKNRIRVLEKENQELKNRIRTLKVMLSEDTSEIRTLGMMLDDIVIHFENTVDDRLMRMDMESVVIRYRKYLRKRGGR